MRVSRVRLKSAEVLRYLGVKCLSQREFARKCQISEGFLSQTLSGVRCPSAKTRRQLLRVLHGKFDDWFVLHPEHSDKSSPFESESRARQDRQS